MNAANLPAPVSTGALARLQDAIDSGMAPALAIMLDEKLFDQVQRIAAIMSKAAGFVPKHCVGQTEVCFAIVTRSLVWALDPFAVAQCTYQPVEGGKVAYEGKLVQAILEQSGRIEGQIKRVYKGDWSKVQGKFRMQTSEKGKKYAVATYTDADEEGLSITLIAQVKGESEPRTVDLDLRQCHPRNSTLWATDAHTQIYYRAVRMLGNVAMPSLLMGVPFIADEEDEDTRARRARNVTPVDVEARASAPPQEILVIDPDGEERAFLLGEIDAKVTEWCRECTDEQLEQLVEHNLHVSAIRDAVEAEELRRASVKPEQHEDDPLHLNDIVGAMGFLTSLRIGIEQATAVDADKFWQIYREKAKRADDKINAGDYAALDALVTAKIKGA